MSDPIQHLDPHLRFRLRQIRKAIRRRRLWRAAAPFAYTVTSAAVTIALLSLALRPSPAIQRPLTFVFWAVVIAAAVKWLIPAIRRKTTLAEAAILVDQTYPELDHHMTALYGLGDKGRKLNFLEERLMDQARTHAIKTGFGTEWREAVPIYAWRGAVSVAALVTLFTLVQVPEVWSPFTNRSWSLGGPFSVEPGDTKVRLGDDLTVVVKSKLVEQAATIRWRSGGEWREEPMRAGDDDAVRFHHFNNIRADHEYQILFGRHKSERYDIQVWMPPEVLGIDLVYHFPDYLGMTPREAPNSGPIAAVSGTRVVLDARVNKALDSAEIIFESGREPVAMSRAEDRIMRGEFVVDADDVYHILLTDRDGEQSLYNPTYDIAVQVDEAPIVRIEFPFRDMEVSPLDELDFAFTVNDDFGVDSYGLRYEVAGRQPVEIPLQTDTELQLNAEAIHQIMLEELDLQPGDLITWSVFARDRKPDRVDYEVMTSPYFLEVRPFQRRFMESISDQGASLAGGQQSGPGDLVQRQKEILISIWNLRKKLNNIEREAFEVDQNSISGAQREVQDAAGQLQVEGDLRQRLDQAFNDVRTAVDRANFPDAAPDLSNAAVAAQTAYQLLVKAQPPESRVQNSQNASGGGSGSQRQTEGLDDLEMDRNRNFYEDEKRTEAQQQAAREALDKLDELSQRQEMVNQEIAKLISELEDVDTPEARRRLESLREELRKNLEKLDQMQQDLAQMDPSAAEDARRQLDQAREQIDRSLQNLEQENLQEARAAGARAAEDLEELEQKLEQQAAGSAEERLEKIQQALDQMTERQQQIQERLQAMDDQKDSPKLSGEDPAHENKTGLLDDKKAQAEDFENMIQDAADLANQVRNSQELLSRELNDWLRETSREGLLEEIEETQDLARLGDWEQLAEREADLAEKLRQVAESFEPVEQALVRDELDANQKALNEIEQLLQAERPGRNQSEQSRPGQPRSGEPDERSMEDFMREDYREWLDRLERSEILLSGQGQAPRELNQGRRAIERYRNRYRQIGDPPGALEFEEAVVRPLTEAADKLRINIQALRREREFIVEDEGAAPDQYRKLVSEYFRLLSESEEER